MDSALDAGGASWHSAASGGVWGAGASSIAASSSGGATQYFEAADASAAGSALTSLRSGFSGLVSSTAATLQGIAAGGPDGSAAPLPPPPLSWQLHVSTANLSVLLFYPDAVAECGLLGPRGEGAGAYAGDNALQSIWARDSAEGSIEQAPHVSIECTDLEVRAFGGGAEGRSSGGVRVYRLEAAEHLPGSPEAATELNEAAWVPDALPPAPSHARPRPSFFGAVPASSPAAASPAVAATTTSSSGRSAFTLPSPGLVPSMRRSAMGGGQRSLYSSTLSELSFMSASGMLGSSQQALAESAASLRSGPAAAAAPPATMLVRPVLCCGGGGRLEGGSPSLHVAVQLPDSGGARSAAADRATALSPAGAGEPDARHRVLADVTLKPVTLWVSLPLLQRLEAYATAVFPPAAAAPPAAVDAAKGGQHSSEALAPAVPQQQAAKSAAQLAIDSILLDMQVRPLHAQQLLSSYRGICGIPPCGIRRKFPCAQHKWPLCVHLKLTALGIAAARRLSAAQTRLPIRRLVDFQSRSSMPGEGGKRRHSMTQSPVCCSGDGVAGQGRPAAQRPGRGRLRLRRRPARVRRCHPPPRAGRRRDAQPKLHPPRHGHNLVGRRQAAARSGARRPCGWRRAAGSRRQASGTAAIRAGPHARGARVDCGRHRNCRQGDVLVVL